MKSIWNKEITVQLNGNLVAVLYRDIQKYIEQPQDFFWRGTVKDLVNFKGCVPNSDYIVYWKNKSSKIKHNGKVRLYLNNPIDYAYSDIGIKCNETDNVIIKIKHTPSNIKNFQKLMEILPPDDFIEWLKDKGIVTMPINIKTGDEKYDCVPR